MRKQITKCTLNLGVLVVVLGFAFNSNAQTDHLQKPQCKSCQSKHFKSIEGFTESKMLNDSVAVVYLDLLGKLVPEKNAKLESYLQIQTDFKFIRLFDSPYGNTRCQLEIPISTTPEKIQDIFKLQGFGIQSKSFTR
jgi:hypothetical protein